jgi:hypothetical protein
MSRDVMSRGSRENGLPPSRDLYRFPLGGISAVESLEARGCNCRLETLTPQEKGWKSRRGLKGKSGTEETGHNNQNFSGANPSGQTVVPGSFSAVGLRGDKQSY